MDKDNKKAGAIAPEDAYESEAYRDMSASWKALLAATIAVCGAPLDCGAFSPDRHRDISRDAIAGYLACTGIVGKPSPVALDTLLEFAKGARNEDATQLVTRLTNWHYYNTGGPPARAWLGIARTNLDGIFRQRVDEALAIRNARPAECTPAALYEAMGRAARLRVAAQAAGRSRDGNG